MFGRCPVVRVKHGNPEGFVEINESDFDASIHQRFDDAEPDPAPKRKKADKAE